jgi:hypothetical protein
MPDNDPDPGDDNDLVTTPFLGLIVQRILWPPPDPNFYPVTNREVLAVVRAAAVPGLRERVGLQESELWKDKDAGDAPSLVLGPMEVLRGPDGGKQVYGPSLVYALSSVAAWTRRFSTQRQRKDMAEALRDAAAQEKEGTRPPYPQLGKSPQRAVQRVSQKVEARVAG